MMKKFFLLLVLSIAALSCDKDEPDTDDVGTPMEKLTGTSEKRWKLSFAEASNASGLKVNLLTSEPCVADNVLVLRNDGTYSLVDEGIKCSVGSGVNDNWSLDEAKNQIFLGELFFLGRSLTNLTLDIKELKKSTFSGDVNTIPQNSVGVTKVSLSFVEVK